MINIESSIGPLPVAPSILERAARAVLLHQKADGDITVVLADNARLQQLNREYLGVDAPTDVLSFPSSETDPDTGARYLGDILISIPRAAQQAKAAGDSLESELQLLVVHGVLHLLGHDHAGSAEKKRMWIVQSDVLHELGLSGIKIPE